MYENNLRAAGLQPPAFFSIQSSVRLFRFLDPLTCISKNLVMSYTTPSMTTQADFGVLCVWISSAVTSRPGAGGAPESSSNAGCPAIYAIIDH